MRTEDAFIVQECLNGESEAFGILVDKYKAGIYAYVYAKLGNLQDAEDATQEVFLAAYRSLNTLRRWESFSFWLYRLARNVCGNRIRTQSKRPDSEFIEDQDAIIVSAFSMNSYRENQVDESLREALGVLSEGYREVLMLHYFGGMKSADIARSLGMSPTAVRKRLSRARMQLREEMTAMMDTAFEGQRLPVTFTFRVVEAVKRIKINPMPRMAGLPLGFSLAMGIIITVMSLNPQVNISSDMAVPTGAPLPAQMKTLKVGEIAVDILKADEIAVIASKQGDDNGGEPKNSLMLAPAAEGGTWAEKNDMPTPRSISSAAVVNGKIYVIGGAKTGVVSTSTVEEYDPVKDTWDKKTDMPTSRMGAAASVVNGKIYVIGGARTGWTPLATVEEYDPETDIWTKKSDMANPRWYFAIGMVNNKIYAIGGWNSLNVNIPALSSVEEYDPATDTWTEKKDMLKPIGTFSAGVVNDKIYITGGYDSKVLATVAEYDPATNAWTEKKDMPTARDGHCTEALDGKIYVIGGLKDDVETSITEQYDPATDTWTKKESMKTTRTHAASSMFDGKIYVIGGAQFWPTMLSTVEEYTPEGWPFSVSPRTKLPTTWGEVKQR